MNYLIWYKWDKRWTYSFDCSFVISVLSSATSSFECSKKNQPVFEVKESTVILSANLPLLVCARYRRKPLVVARLGVGLTS